MSAPPAPSLPPRPATTQLRARRSPRLLLIGLLAMVLGGLGAAILYDRATTTEQVIVTTRSIVRGEVITSGDLRVVDLNVRGGVAHVAAARMNEIAGQHALADLPEAALISEASYGQIDATPGHAQLGLRLTPGRVPVRPLQVGTKVRLVAVSTSDDKAPAEAAASAAVVPATVVTSPQASSDGSAVLLDVEVPSDQATLIAHLAAADKVVVVREPEQ